MSDLVEHELAVRVPAAVRRLGGPDISVNLLRCFDIHGVANGLPVAGGTACIDVAVDKLGVALRSNDADQVIVGIGLTTNSGELTTQIEFEPQRRVRLVGAARQLNGACCPHSPTRTP